MLNLSKTSTDPLDDHLLEAMVQVSFRVIGRLTYLAGREGLSLTQLRMLAILRDRSARMAELSEALGIERSSVSGLIARAEQRGLVIRIAAKGDRRGVVVQLSDAGHHYTRDLSDAIARALGDLIMGLDDNERTSLTDALIGITASSRG